MTELLSRYAPRLGIRLSSDQLAQFAEYTRLLMDANRRVNLTAVIDPAEIQVRHYLDSLTAVLALPEWPDGRRVVDIGAGAGFPGIPLKIAFPGIRLTLADSVGKKTAFLRDLTARLGLADVETLTIRAEDLGRAEGYRGQFDVALARGVAAMPALVEYALPLCKGNGHLLAWKGKDGPAEAHAAAGALQALRGKIAGIYPADALSPPLPSDRWLVSVQKTGRTPGRYPRRAGVPTRQAL